MSCRIYFGTPQDVYASNVFDFPGKPICVYLHMRCRIKFGMTRGFKVISLALLFRSHFITLQYKCHQIINRVLDDLAGFYTMQMA